mmetsp:Transcript_3836/g.12150  ORF Transcript_3836/g.12150 Transcript_3836/m.12150 type:complete len:340 (-) Transcript_3836:344-1363(-)
MNWRKKAASTGTYPANHRRSILRSTSPSFTRYPWGSTWRTYVSTKLSMAPSPQCPEGRRGMKSLPSMLASAMKSFTSRWGAAATAVARSAGRSIAASVVISDAIESAQIDMSKNSSLRRRLLITVVTVSTSAPGDGDAAASSSLPSGVSGSTACVGAAPNVRSRSLSRRMNTLLRCSVMQRSSRSASSPTTTCAPGMFLRCPAHTCVRMKSMILCSPSPGQLLSDSTTASSLCHGPSPAASRAETYCRIWAATRVMNCVPGLMQLLSNASGSGIGGTAWRGGRAAVTGGVSPRNAKSNPNSPSLAPPEAPRSSDASTCASSASTAACSADDGSSSMRRP